MDAPSPRARSLLIGSVIAAVALVAAVGGALVAASSSSEDSADDGGTLVTDGDIAPIELGPSDAEGDLVPDTTFELLDGSSASFADFRGRPVVLNFFASTCQPCIAEMPRLEAAARRYDGQVTFLGLAVQDRAADAQRIVDDTGVTYTTGLDPTAEVIRAFDSVVLPSTVFITAEGTVSIVHRGEISAADLEGRIRGLLA